MKVITKWLPLLAALTVTTIASAASPKMTCTLTGKEVKTRCCQQQKNGKLLCKLAKKEVDKCCCNECNNPPFRPSRHVALEVAMMLKDAKRLDLVV
jgi:hypothetical protein